MGAIAPIKKSSILGTTALTTSATIAEDVTSSGSPGNFDPEGFVPDGVAKWVDRSSGFQIGYPTLTLSSRPPNKTSRLTRVQCKLVQPILEITSPSTSTGIQPAPTLAYNMTYNSEWLLPDRSSLAERTAFFSLVKSLYFDTITASDGAPSTATGSPLPAAILALDKPY